MLSNAVIIWASRVLLLVPQVIFVPYLIGTIGEVGYGVYALVWSLLMSIDRFESSLQSGVVKYSAAFLAEGRADDVNRVVSSSFVYSMGLGVVASATICIAGLWQGTSADLGFSLLVVAGFVLLIIPLAPYVGLIQARQRYYVQVIAQTLSRYGSLALVFAWFKWVAPSIEALIIIMVGMLFLSRLAQVPVAYRLVPGLSNRPGLFDRGLFRLIVAFGGMTIFIALCGIANTTGIRWLMGLLVSASFVTHLAIMLVPGGLLSQIVSAMTMTVMPATSIYEATGNGPMLQELLVRSMRYTTIIVLAALFVGVLLVEDVLTLWVGPDYTFLAPYTLAIFGSVAFSMTTSSARHMFKGLGKLRTTAVIALTGKVLIPLTLILGVFLRYHDPYLAVAAGLVTGNVVLAALHVGFSLVAIDARLPSALLRVYGQPLLAAAAVAAPLLVLGFCGVLDTPIARAAAGALAPTAFLAAMYFLLATPAERQQAAQIVQAFHRHFGAAFRIRPTGQSTRL